MIVVDNSALVEMLAVKGPVGEAVASRTAQEEDLAAPYLLDTEVMSALLGLIRGRKLSESQAESAMAHYRALPLDRYETAPLWSRIKALHANLSAYDATYVALAEVLGATLITSDARIARSGAARCAIEVFE
ncbi:type II toxin-antitoxin system VapC family toxin [Nocardiopsis chromatogenes]|uniref:type II toxin-antitoxin system VapC family toxin n=1 Tax=Nocardiopsis chromatogenes TaxID=280239 RepID=UPI0003473CCB|nr:type II toxin-antitoxin system VapC family toxin [Nocardiopsis chromatogenes]